MRRGGFEDIAQQAPARPDPVTATTIHFRNLMRTWCAWTERIGVLPATCRHLFQHEHTPKTMTPTTGPNAPAEQIHP